MAKCRAPGRERHGHFLVVTTDNGTNIDFMNADGEIVPTAVCLSESEFDEIFARVRERSFPYWPDPAQTQAGEIRGLMGEAFTDMLNLT